MIVRSTIDRLLELIEIIAVRSGYPNLFLAAIASGVAAMLVLLLQQIFG